jgi:hypothetical protein
MRKVQNMVEAPKKPTADPKVEIITINPAMAHKLLEKNTHNRSISQMTVARLAAAMKTGEWALNNDAIVVDADGTVLNGQHRLQAITQSGATITTLFMQGLKQEAQFTMDLGKKRSYGEHLQILGVSGHTTNIAMALRMFRFYVDFAARKGNSTCGEFMAFYVNRAQWYPFAILDRTLQEHPMLVESVKTASRAILRGSGRQAALNGAIGSYGAAIYLVRMACEERGLLWEDFERPLFMGVELTETDPRFHLRNARRTNNAREALPREMLAYMRCFNLYLEKTPVKRGITIRDVETLVLPAFRLPKACTSQLQLEGESAKSKRKSS